MQFVQDAIGSMYVPGPLSPSSIWYGWVGASNIQPKI